MESIPNTGRRTSRQKRADQFLRKKQIEQTLTALANIPDLPPVGTVTTERPIVLPLRTMKTKQGNVQIRVATSTEPGESIESIKKHYPELFADYTYRDICVWRDLLREAWNSSDLGRKAWFVFVLRNFHARITRLVQAFREDGGRRRIIDWRAARETWDALLKFEKPDDEKLGVHLFNFDDAVLDRAAREAMPPAPTDAEETLSYLQRNLDRALKCKSQECPAPYFFRNRKGQEYCSPDCSAWGRRHSNKISARKSRKKGRKT